VKKFVRPSFYIFIVGLFAALILQYVRGTDVLYITGVVSKQLPFSPLTILIFIFFLDYVLLKLLRNQDVKLDLLDKNQKIVAFFLYIIILLVGIGLIFIIRSLYFTSNLDYRVQALFEIGYKEIFWFFVFLFLFITYFLFSVLLNNIIDRLSISLKIKLILVFIPVVILFYIASNFIPVTQILPVALSFMIYIFVLDLYMDQKKINSTWIFTWMIIIAGFTSLVVYSAYSDFLQKKDITSIKQLVFSRDIDLENQLTLSDITEKNENYIIRNKIIDSTEFISNLNFGFYSLGNNLFFNPVIGDYIRLDSITKNKDRFYIKYLYNISKNNNSSRLMGSPEYIVVYSGKVLFNNTGLTDIPVPESLKDSNEINEYFVGGYLYLKYKKDANTTIIKIEKIPGILRPLSLFSLLFVMMGMIFFIISVLNSKFKFLPEILELSFNGINTLKDRIQFSIIGLLIISFFVLGIITFHYFSNFYESNQKEKANLFSSIILSDFNAKNAEIDSIYILDKLLTFERKNDVGFYYYNNRGKLVKDKRRINDDLHNVPLKILNLQGYVNKDGQGFIRRNDYLISIVPLIIGDKDKGYIAGYFLNNNAAVIAASDILSNFLNVYVLLFLLSGAIAIALANSISKPIEILGEKMEILSLNENNELLKWNKKDEIGKLISIYNLTVKKLKESAKIITKIERDSAWRDMAKQVAHEIKNPLTPLKLNIQYLESFVTRQPERASEMIKQLAPGMIEQINNLDKIATEFSDFAKMPSARNEKVNLNEIVKAVHDFFRKREDLEIQLYVPINDLIVFADKNHIVSILNNIIKNAIQAIPTERKGRITIDLYKEKDNAIIKITDNGTGISDEMKSKVFSPNFTTKSSGTGLGLAISSNMIQAFNGKIYFDTKINEGTSFFVEIPLMRIKENYNGQKRVSLDD